MKIDLNQTLREFGLFQGFVDSDIQKIIKQSSTRHFQSGDKLCRQGETGSSMFIIYSGRVSMWVIKPDGQEHKLNILHSGDHFGELVLLSGGTRTASAIAITDVTVLEIQSDEFFTLLNNIPTFSINLSRTISCWLQNELKGKPAHKKLHIIGIVRTSNITQHLSFQIIESILDKEKEIALFTDRPESWINNKIKKLHPLTGKSKGKSDQTNHKEQKDMSSIIIDASKRYDHVIIDINQENTVNDSLLQCERIWCLLEQKENQDPNDQISTLISAPALQKRIQLVWVQPQSYDLLDIGSETPETAHPQIRCQYDTKSNTLRKMDLSRLYHQLKGVQIGIALGGGGARCLAHIGVLRALEENGLYFDRIAGTSGGAIIAAFYAAGYDKKYMLELFENNMTPPRWLRSIPHGHKWYLMTLFRFGLIKKRFQQIFKKTTFEQLLLPLHIVSSDLVSGKEAVKTTGGIADSVMESINHPLLAKPIFHDGKALVDGGILNNVPSSILRSANIDYVVSVNIGSKLSLKFGDNCKNTSKTEMKRVGFISTLSRILEVGHNGLEKRYEDESDFLILPDTSDFLFEDFTKGQELFDLGYNTTMALMPELKESYQKFMKNE